MNRHQRETIRGLFTSAAIILDQATRAATSGQSPHITDAAATSDTTNLHKLDTDLIAIAKAVQVVIQASEPRRPRTR